MTKEQKLNKLSSLTGETDMELLSTYLEIAGSKIIAKAYPFRSDISKVPTKYEMIQVDIAVFLYNKRGAEGETYHSENGINRTYETASVPDSMLANVVPFVSTL